MAVPRVRTVSVVVSTRVRVSRHRGCIRPRGGSDIGVVPSAAAVIITVVQALTLVESIAL